jgi:hypothetical protein
LTFIISKVSDYQYFNRLSQNGIFVKSSYFL